MDKPQASAAAPGYETRDANTRSVFNFLVTLAIILVATSLVCWGMFRYFTLHEVEGPATVSPFADTRQLPLGPQLQVNPAQDLRNYKDQQNKSLETLDWANRSAGTARVPIEVAIDLLVKKGVPVQAEPGQAVFPKAQTEANKKQ